MRMAFPTEIGFPFLYTYSAPSMIRLHGHIKATVSPKLSQEMIQRPDTIQIQPDITLTISSKIQGRLSFITPFDQHQFISGYDKQTQFNIPVRGTLELDVQTQQIKTEFEGEHSSDKTHLFHYSSWPYISRINSRKFEPVSGQPHTRILREEKLNSYGRVVQKHMGVAFEVQMEHERQLIDVQHLKHSFVQHGPTRALLEFWKNPEIQYSQINVAHLPKESLTKKLIIGLGRKQQYQFESDDVRSMQFINAENSEERLKEAIEKVRPGIKNVKSESYDVSVEFKGDKNIKYALTAAYAKSDVDPKSKIIVNLKQESNDQGQKPYRVNFEAENHIENTNELDMKYSMENEPKMSGEMKLSFRSESGKPSTVKAKWQFARSEDRREYLRQDHMYKHCQEEMTEGNNQLPACANITMESNLFDKVEAEIQYENVPQHLQEVIRTFYYGARYNYYPYTDIDKQHKYDKENSFKLQGNFEPDLRNFNVSIQNNKEKFTFMGIPVDEWNKRAFVPHPVYHVRSRLMAYALGLNTYRRK